MVEGCSRVKMLFVGKAGWSLHSVGKRTDGFLGGRGVEGCKNLNSVALSCIGFQMK